MVVTEPGVAAAEASAMATATARLSSTTGVGDSSASRL